MSSLYIFYKTNLVGILVKNSDATLSFKYENSWINMKDSFPLKVEARKIIKLRDKRLSAVMIWSCLDGILYLPIDGLSGSSYWDESTGELMLSYSNKKIFKYVRKS